MLKLGLLLLITYNMKFKKVYPIIIITKFEFLYIITQIYKITHDLLF